MEECANYIALKALLPGYFATVQDQKAQQRYKEKLSIIFGVDPYEISKNDWTDNVDLWPAITHIHIGMYLLLNPSPYIQRMIC